MRRFLFRSVLAFAVWQAFPAAAQAPAADDPPEPQAPAASEGLSRLIGALQSGETFKVRATAAVALGRMSEKRALPALTDALRGDDSFAVRAAAASAIGRLGDAAGLPPLFDALHDREQYVREVAEEALGRFRSPEHLFAFRDALRSDDPLVRLAAVAAYGEVMREPTSSVGVAAQVINALGDDDEAVVESASQAVATLPHDRAIPLLIDGLLHGGSSVRTSCARLLEKRTDSRAVEPLTEVAVDTDQPESVRRAAAAALKKHSEYLDTAAVVATAGAVGNPDRVRAMRVLAMIGDARALAAVQSALGDSDAAVRTGAARAAADMSSPQARGALAAAAEREADPRQKRQLELILKSIH